MKCVESHIPVPSHTNEHSTNSITVYKIKIKMPKSRMTLLLTMKMTVSFFRSHRVAFVALVDLFPVHAMVEASWPRPQKGGSANIV